MTSKHFAGMEAETKRENPWKRFWRKYDPYRYKNPCCTVDMAVFGYSGTEPERPEDLKVLLIRRKNHPSIGDWALPGGIYRPL